MVSISKIVNFKLFSSYAFIYLGITILLWDTFGMLGTSNPYPFALIFLTFIALILLVKKDDKNLNFLALPLLKTLITCEILLHIIAYFHLPHSNFHFAKEIRNESFVLVFLIVIISIWLIHLLKSENKVWMFFLVGISSLFLVYCIYVALNPAIDTFHYMEIATEEFINGKNPYLISFADYYNGEFKGIYGGEYVFNYWPVNLYLCAFSKLIFSDVRFIMVIFQLSIGFVLLINSYQKKYNQELFYFFLLWILNPVVAFVNIQAWVDAFAPLLLILTIIFLQKRKLLFSAFALGLLASIKLYYCFTVPFILIYIWNHERNYFFRYFTFTFFGFIITLIPFLIISPNELFYNTIVYFTKSQLRLESLSYVAYIKYLINIDLSQVGLILSLLIILYGYARACIRKLELLNLLQVMNFTYLAFFLFSKQAFCNYYYYNLFLTFLLIYYSLRFDPDREGKRVELVN